jgi:EpsI family protein
MTSLSRRVSILVGALMVAAAAVARADRIEAVPMRTPFASFPAVLGDWRVVSETPLSPSVAKVLGADDYLSRVYVSAGVGAGVFVGYWSSQRQGDTIHSPQNCLPGAGWEPVSQGRIDLPDPRQPGAGPITVNRYVIQKGLHRQLVLYWYQSHGRVIASEYWGRVYLMLDAARLNRTDGAMVRIVVPIGQEADAIDEAERLARAFAQVLIPALDGYLPE